MNLRREVMFLVFIFCLDDSLTLLNRRCDAIRGASMFLHLSPSLQIGRALG